jgi:hypothetical protein
VVTAAAKRATAAMPIVTVSGDPVSAPAGTSPAPVWRGADLASHLLYDRDGALAFLFGDDADLAPDLPAR